MVTKHYGHNRIISWLSTFYIIEIHLMHAQEQAKEELDPRTTCEYTKKGTDNLDDYTNAGIAPTTIPFSGVALLELEFALPKLKVIRFSPFWITPLFCASGKQNGNVMKLENKDMKHGFFACAKTVKWSTLCHC